MSCKFFIFWLAFYCVNVPAVNADVNWPPRKIASLNLCLDALLLKLVEPSRINSLTYLSGNPQFSPFAAQAIHYHLNRGLAEDLALREPDLIVAGDFGATDAKHLLLQLGFRVETLALPRTLDEIGAHIRRFGQVTGSQIAAESMASQLEEQLRKLDLTHKHRAAIPAFWYSSNGVVVGEGTLENELMTRAGFHNLAVDQHLQGFAQMDLENIILAQPKVIIIETADVKAFSLAQEYIEHPALGAHHMRIIRLPATLSVCIAPIAANVINNLMQQINDIHVD